jgi:hypothetical protein
MANCLKKSCQVHVCVKKRFNLEQATKAQSGVDVQLYSFFNLSARWRWVVNTMLQLLYAWERDQVCTV